MPVNGEKPYLTPVHDSWRAWLPTLALSAAAFVFVTTEFLPVGLLTDIALSFHIKDSLAGKMVAGYAIVVATMSLPLALLCAKFERRKLMLSILVIFMLSHFLAVFAQNMTMLMTSRVLIALTHAIFWGIVTPMAARVAPEGNRARGLALVISGGTLATILGIPIGTLLGHLFNWRIAFGCVVIAALPVFFGIYKLVPKLPSVNSGSLSSLPSLLTRKPLIKIYAITLLAVTGHFIVYTYINPYLKDVGQYDAGVIPLLLLVLGGAGIPASLYGSRYVEKYPFASLVIPLIALALSLILLELAMGTFMLTIPLLFFWSAAMSITGLSLQTRVMDIAPDSTDVAISMYSGIFNLGIGSGAFFGGEIMDSMGVHTQGYLGSLLVGTSLLVCILPRILMKNKNKQ